MLALVVGNGNIDVRQEGIWAICNAITGADLHTRELMFREGKGDSLIASLVHSLKFTQEKLLVNVLESF